MTATTLRDLLQEAVDKRKASGLDASMRGLQLAVEAEEAVRPRGLALNRTTASEILKRTYKKVPTAGTIRAIAWLAGVSDEVAFTSAGRRVPGPPFAMELPPGIDDLSQGERRAAIEVLRTLIAQRQEINRYESLLAHSSASTRTSSKARKEKEDLAALSPPEIDDVTVTKSITPDLGEHSEDTGGLGGSPGGGGDVDDEGSDTAS